MSLLIRSYTTADLARMKQLHEMQGFDYEMPDLERPEFIIRSVIENSQGVEAGLFLRKTAEVYLLMQAMTKKAGLGRIGIFEKEIIPLARQEGLTDVHCWVPPEIEKHFGKLLQHLGWQKQLWASYSRKVG